MSIINCPECNEKISDTCKVCIKCGYKFRNKKSISIDKLKRILKNILNKAKSVPKKIKILIISIILIVIIVVSYIVAFNNAYELAKEYYSEEDYGIASSKIEYFLLNISGEDKFDIIKESGNHNYYMYYDFAQRELNKLSIDYEKACEYLLKGLDSCNRYYNSIDNPTDIQTEVYNNFKNKYSSKLYVFFDMDETARKEALSDYDNIEKYAKTYGQKAKKAQYYNDNPVEFRNTSLTSNSLYTIVTGTVYNRSSKTIKFVTVKASFLNSNGQTIDTDWTYAVGSEGLAPR